MTVITQSKLGSPGGQSSLASMDVTAEYLRTHIWRILPLYVVAMLPFSLAVMYTIDAVTSQYRAMLTLTSFLLVIATLWRWVWLAALQRRVQADIRGGAPRSVRRRIVPILLLRLAASACALWGSIFIAPGLYGFLMSGMATPLSLDPSERQWSQIKSLTSWISRSYWRLSKVLNAMLFLYLISLGCIFGGIRFLLGWLLPAFLGINPSDVDFTLGSWTGILIVSYLVALVFDLFWAILSVMIFYELQSRRLAPDLRVRLRKLKESSS